MMHLFGRALRRLRPGLPATVLPRLNTAAHGMALHSPAFTDGGILPRRFTADGRGALPPLAWSGVPENTESLALIVEDADSPFPRPIVHLILHGIIPATKELPEGDLSPATATPGRNSFARAGWLPPAPIPGHGPHRYVFQLLALDTPPHFAGPPGKRAFLAAIDGHVLAGTSLVGTYERM